jgi:RNA polymerase subunit RPABC4/transcription elongation factor Spt4
MPDMVQNAERDFWTPPVAPPPITVEPAAHASMVEACDQCETEFIPGAKFCHVCGTPRATQATAGLWVAWLHRSVAAVRNLEFERVASSVAALQQRLGLSLAALIAFAIGLFCVLGAIFVGLIFTVQTTLDWQAVQVWRIEWLLGASVSFLAGILLKKSAH